MEVFYWTTGTGIGVLASLLILIYVMSRFVPTVMFLFATLITVCILMMICNLLQQMMCSND
jgi:hypothetical protein